MLYIVSQLITEKQATAFSILGASEDKKRAAKIAVDAYKAYRREATGQNIAMIQEWLETRRSYSFRRDKDHRLQLAVTELDGEVQAEEKRLVFSAQAEQDELMRRVSEALWEGQHVAGRGAAPSSCPMDPADKGEETR
ncbi:MAG: hypothetical protein SOV43_08535 [Selenomonadaceae bacterium]|nr:hypothetical protein [Selenomonadaceae bacterium]MDY2686203.1 hypothetical protein [Selenomonadaceae bacterium]